MDQLFPIRHSYLIPLLPLLGAAVSGFFGARWLRQRSHWPIWIGVGGAAALSLWLLVSMLGMQPHHDHAAGDEVSEASHLPAHEASSAIPGGDERIRTDHNYPLAANVNWFHWITIGQFDVTAGFFFDPLTAVMLCVVCGIGFLITVFAKGYMAGEAGYFRFFAYLGLFIFAMTCLVMGNNLIMLYLGWEGVGLCSYLLIGYYYERPAAREAAKKAFLVNRIGDFGFALGIMLCYWAFGTVSYFGAAADGNPDGLLEMARTVPLLQGQAWALQWIPFLLMLGAFGKSAQFPLHVWLPDAMEGPTPVSALIHAATMVTAGVYMIVRCGTLFVANEAALITIAAIGGFTALFAGSIALRQFDLKKVFAYSTVSQLGFMFVGAAVLAPVAGVFHLVTHAFFKALLFLSSGVVMHAMAGELDMRKMSGLGRVLPKTRLLMLIGCLALAGVPFLSGFFSKDEIIANAWEHSRVLGGVLLLTALLTAYYTFRLYFRVFAGPEIIPAAPPHGHAAHGAGHDAHHNHEPLSMMLPLFVLAVGAVLVGYINWPQHALGHFLGQSPSLHQSFLLSSARYVDEFGGSRVNPVPFGQNDFRDEDVVAAEHGSHLTFMIVSALVAALGILLAYQVHLRDRARADRVAASVPWLTRLLEARYWVDEIYQNAIVEPLRSVGRALFAMDRYVVDGLVSMVGFVPLVSGFLLKYTTQRGYLQGYAVAMIFGVAAILLIVLM